MAGNDKRRKVRSESMALDTMHIIIGIAIAVMAIASFLNPEEYMVFFPVIFLLAAVLNLVTGKYHAGRSSRDKRRKAAAIVQMIFGAALAVLSVISAVSIWWR